MLNLVRNNLWEYMADEHTHPPEFDQIIGIIYFHLFYGKNFDDINIQQQSVRLVTIIVMVVAIKLCLGYRTPWCMWFSMMLRCNGKITEQMVFLLACSLLYLSLRCPVQQNGLFLRSSLIVFSSEVITLLRIQTLHLFIFIIRFCVWKCIWQRASV